MVLFKPVKICLNVHYSRHKTFFTQQRSVVAIEIKLA